MLEFMNHQNLKQRGILSFVKIENNDAALKKILDGILVSYELGGTPGEDWKLRCIAWMRLIIDWDGMKDANDVQLTFEVVILVKFKFKQSHLEIQTT